MSDPAIVVIGAGQAGGLGGKDAARRGLRGRHRRDRRGALPALRAPAFVERGPAGQGAGGFQLSLARGLVRRAADRAQDRRGGDRDRPCDQDGRAVGRRQHPVPQAADRHRRPGPQAPRRGGGARRGPLSARHRRQRGDPGGSRRGGETGGHRRRLDRPRSRGRRAHAGRRGHGGGSAGPALRRGPSRPNSPPGCSTCIAAGAST